MAKSLDHAMDVVMIPVCNRNCARIMPSSPADPPANQYDLVVQAEVAMELVNRAQTLVQGRLSELEGQPSPDTVQVARLMIRSRQLHALLRTIDYRETGKVNAMIHLWGPLTQNTSQFWEVMQHHRPLPTA
jgi:hypothetical protein